MRAIISQYKPPRNLSLFCALQLKIDLLTAKSHALEQKIVQLRTVTFLKGLGPITACRVLSSQYIGYTIPSLATVRIWNIRNDDETTVLKLANSAVPVSFVLIPSLGQEEMILAVSYNDSKVRRIDIKTKEIIKIIDFDTIYGQPIQLYFSNETIRVIFSTGIVVDCKITKVPRAK